MTYAWADNQDRQVEYVAQELKTATIDVAIDQWKLQSGARLWEQIANWITDAERSQAWLIYATPASLASKACQEEFHFALNRALDRRGQNFPIIALFPNDYDSDLIPPSLQIRLNVSLTDAHWKEKVHAAVEGRELRLPLNQIQRYIIDVKHAPFARDQFTYVIEMRPRLGTWSPFLVAVPVEEFQKIAPKLIWGPKGQPTLGTMLFSRFNERGSIHDGDTELDMHICGAHNAASATDSYYLWCKELPSTLYFGPPLELNKATFLTGG